MRFRKLQRSTILTIASTGDPLLVLLENSTQKWKGNVTDEASKWERGTCLPTSGRLLTRLKYLSSLEEVRPVDAKPSLQTTTEELKSCLDHQTNWTVDGKLDVKLI